MSAASPSGGMPSSGSGRPDPLAALGAELDRRERAARRREIPVVAGLVVFGAVLAGGGAPSALLVLIGSWVAGFGLLLLVGRSVRDREERGVGRRGAVSVAELDGARATVLYENGTRATLTAGATAYPGLLFLALAVLGAARGLHLALVVVAGVVGAGFVTAAVRQASRARRAGVWLTPTALVVVRRDSRQRVAWCDVVAVSEPRGPAELVVVRARSGAAVESAGRSRRPTGLAEEVVISPASTAIDAPSIARVIRHYASGADTAVLGTAAGVSTVRDLARS